ncbi:MAG: GNAT family N-acetyltransferase [Desulfobacterales bacterium]|nr:GNAT family N-acetyltransferase [Desulfobacterales bacterium]
MELTITLLNPKHQRTKFHCGEDSLDQYIRQYAKQDNKRRISRVFVASPIDNPAHITGYYTLSAGSLDTTSLPDTMAKRLPKYPVPVALLGRLAIDTHHQGRGVGTLLIADALKRVHQAAKIIAVYALVVDALNEGTVNFYQQFGFIPLPNTSNKLFLPLDTISEIA